MYKRKEYQPILNTSKKESYAIKRFQAYENKDVDNKSIVAFSGGKDSIVIYYLAVLSGIEFVPIYSQTSVDPPELVNFIKNVFNPWAVSNGYPVVIIQSYKEFNNKRAHGTMAGRPITMWNLLSSRCSPPTRLTRYCCDELKERTGDDGDTVFVGVRKAESKKRAKHKIVNIYKGKIMVRPIFEFTDNEVWSFILQNNIPYCELYDNGWNRVG